MLVAALKSPISFHQYHMIRDIKRIEVLPFTILTCSNYSHKMRSLQAIYLSKHPSSRG